MSATVRQWGVAEWLVGGWREQTCVTRQDKPTLGALCRNSEFRPAACHSPPPTTPPSATYLAHFSYFQCGAGHSLLV